MKSGDILLWAHTSSLVIDSVSPDVLGGEGVYLTGVRGRTAWFAVSDAACTVVTSDAAEIVGRRVSCAAELALVDQFLQGV